MPAPTTTLLSHCSRAATAAEACSASRSSGIPTASAWVWSTYLKGSTACRMASTDGVGAEARVMLVRSSLTISGSLSRGSAARRTAGASRTGANPSASIVSRSQPLPLT